MTTQTTLQEYDLDISEIILIHKDVYNPHMRFELYQQGRKSHGFVYVISGNAEYITDSGRYTAEKNSLIYLPSDSKYVVETNTDEPFFHITVNFRINPENDKNGILFDFISGDKILPLTPENFGLYEAIFNNLLSAWKNKKRGFRLKAKSYLYELANEFFSEFMSLQIDRADYEKVAPAKKYIDKNYTETITNSMLAEICGISETHMRRLFAEILKTSPIGYQIDLRILKAKDLLLTGLYTVGETSELCGFSDQNYFTRIFKSRVGVPPLKYKNSQGYN